MRGRLLLNKIDMGSFLKNNINLHSDINDWCSDKSQIRMHNSQISVENLKVECPICIVPIEYVPYNSTPRKNAIYFEFLNSKEEVMVSEKYSTNYISYCLFNFYCQILMIEFTVLRWCWGLVKYSDYGLVWHENQHTLLIMANHLTSSINCLKKYVDACILLGK